MACDVEACRRVSSHKVLASWTFTFFLQTTPPLKVNASIPCDNHKMPDLSKKRRADSDSDEPQLAPTTAKKTKSAASVATPAGKDDDGNPFWEVRSGACCRANNR